MNAGSNCQSEKKKKTSVKTNQLFVRSMTSLSTI